jgi:hypothetical protein
MPVRVVSVKEESGVQIGKALTDHILDAFTIRA